MQKWNVLLIVCFSLVACERAKMTTAGQPKEAIVPVAQNTPQATEKEATAQPAPAVTPKDSTSDVTAPGPIRPSVDVPAVGAFESTPPTRSKCENEDCEQRTMTDEGKYEISQPLRTEPKTKELDVLFVLDTSKSMRDEHEAIAKEIGKFVAELTGDVSYRFAIMLAHGPGSQRGKVGELYSEDGQNLVLSEKDPTLLQIQFQNRLKNLPIDRSVAQGEVGLLNLYKAFSDPNKLSSMKKAGFLRSKAALLIVTVADENDICFDYEEASQKLGHPVEGTYATERDRQSEHQAFLSGQTCAGVVKGQRLKPEHVLESVRLAKGELPVVFTGIHYLEGKVPERTDEFSKDNEAGRGYLELIELAEGQAVDLATQDFSKILAKIGDYSNFKMKFDDIIEISALNRPELLDLNSLVIRIVKETGEYHEFDKANVRPRIQKGKLQLVIDYVAMDYAYRNNWINENSKLQVLYNLKDGAETEKTEVSASLTSDNCLSQKSQTALIYLHDQMKINELQQDERETENRKMLARLGQTCHLTIAMPRSSATQGCEPGKSCWNIKDKKRVEKMLPLIVSETKSCVTGQAIVLLGFGDGGNFLAHASTSALLKPQLDKKIKSLLISGVAKEVMPGPYRIIETTQPLQTIDEKALMTHLEMNGLCVH